MNKTLNILAVIIVVMAVVALVLWRRPKEQTSNATPSVSVEQNQENPTSETLTADYYKQFKSPATCALGGTVKFLSRSVSQNINAYLTYTGIDHDGRLIEWTISPKDDLLIGPNIMAGQTIPNGKVFVGVTLPEKPNAKLYTLTATVQYGRLVNNSIKDYVAKCLGSTKVIIGY